MDVYERIMELAQKGYHCSQIIMIMTLESIGMENEDLVRSLGGLGGGIGFSGNVCGCVTGGACAISYFLGKKSPDEKEPLENPKTVKELVDWFEKDLGPEIGGLQCRDISHLDWSVIVGKCPEIIAGTYEKVIELLSEKGVLE